MTSSINLTIFAIFVLFILFKLNKSTIIALIAPNDILGRRNEIKDCLAAADMAKAVKRLIDFMREFQPDIEDEVILLSMDFHDLKMTLNSTMKQLETDASTSN